MPGIRTFASVTDEIVEVVASKTATLMIGAGASVGSGAPTTAELVGQIVARFPASGASADGSFFDAGTAVCDTPQYGRHSLIGFLKEQLGVLEPSKHYKQFPRSHWRAIFTTNYDDLLEQAYRTPSRVQTLQPIHLPYDLATIPRHNHLYLFYLQGSISRPAHDDASPAVSWSDYHRTIQDRSPAMNTLRNVMVDGGHVIYLGYSFGDFLLEGLLDEAARKLGRVNQPYGYAILPEWSANERTQRKLASYNIIPVQGTFEDFADLVGSVAEHGHQASLRLDAKPSPAAGYAVRVKDQTATLTESEFGVYSEFFEVLNDAAIQRRELSQGEARKKAREFLKGELQGWMPFRQGWAFRRDAYDGLLAHVRSMIGTGAKIGDRLILVHGPAGLGKSVMARQLVHDLYVEEGLPSLLAKPTWRVRPDIRLIDRFVDDLEQKLENGAVRVPLVLVVDEGELVDRTLPSRVVRYLHTRGRDVVCVLFARTNEFFRPAPAGRAPGSWGDFQEIPVTDRLSDDEIERLIRHIINIGVWQQERVTTSSFWLTYIRRDLDASFFDTVYSLVEETQTPLRDRVRSEYDNLGALGQQAYTLISALHKYGLPLKLEVLMRALNADWPTFDAEIIRGDARNVLFADQMTNAVNVTFRGRTRLISEIVFDHAAVDHAKRLETYRQVVGAFSPNDMFGLDELDTLRTLLVQIFGPAGFEQEFSDEEVASLFSIASAIVDDDVIEHHFGLLERRTGRLVSAREHLERALTLTANLPSDVLSQRESAQNVENSLAQVLGDLAVEALTRDAFPEAEELYQFVKENHSDPAEITFITAAFYKNTAGNLMTLANSADDEYSEILNNKALELLTRSVPVWEAVAERNPENPEIWRSMYQIYTQLNMDEKAEDARLKANM
jgi:hypothetical protein